MIHKPFTKTWGEMQVLDLRSHVFLHQAHAISLLLAQSPPWDETIVSSLYDFEICCRNGRELATD
jgi:hypothetical protein